MMRHMKMLRTAIRMVVATTIVATTGMTTTDETITDETTAVATTRGETTKVGLTKIVITMVTSAPRGITCIFRRKKTLHVKLVERSVIDKRSVQLVTPSKLEWLTRHIRRRARPIMRGKPEKLMENICVRPGIAATSEPNHHFILVRHLLAFLGRYDH